MLTPKDKKIEALVKNLIKGGVGSVRGEFRIEKGKIYHLSCYYRFKSDPELNLPESYTIRMHDFCTNIIKEVTILTNIGGSEITGKKYEYEKNPTIHELVYDFVEEKINEIYKGGDLRLGLFIIDANFRKITIYFEDCIVLSTKLN